MIIPTGNFKTENNNLTYFTVENCLKVWDLTLIISLIIFFITFVLSTRRTDYCIKKYLKISLFNSLGVLVCSIVKVVLFIIVYIKSNTLILKTVEINRSFLIFIIIFDIAVCLSCYLYLNNYYRSKFKKTIKEIFDNIPWLFVLKMVGFCSYIILLVIYSIQLKGEIVNGVLWIISFINYISYLMTYEFVYSFIAIKLE